MRGDLDNAKRIRCLIIQFARLGDTLQSLMALRAAQQLYPGLEIHFVVRERFAEAARRIPWIKSVITLPSDAILGPVLEGRGTETQALRDLARWVRPLAHDENEPWDLLLNWSYSEPSSYLTALLPARVKLGYSRTLKDLSHSCPDGWSHYIQAIVQGGVRQNIHLTDVLTTQLLTALQIHHGDPADNGDAPVTSKHFFALRPKFQGAAAAELSASWRDRSRRWIAVQLGAAKPEKAWDGESWAKLVARILEEHPEYSVVLLGGKDDHERAKPVLAVSPRVVSLVEATDFDLWATVVGRSQWLISCDTAALHLASVLGTRVMNLAIGPGRWHETGPYGNGHYVIAHSGVCPACENAGSDHTCRKLSPDLVYGAWSYALQEAGNRNPLLIDRKITEGARVYRSRIRPGGDGGGVVYEPVTSHALRVGEWSAMVMGHIARGWYCGWVPPVGQELSRELISPELVRALRGLEESAAVLQKVCDEAARTAQRLSRHSGRLKSEKIMPLRDRESINELAQKLQDLDALIERLGKTHPLLAAFSQMSHVLMHNLRGTQITELSQESAECYHQLQEGVLHLREWIDFTRKLSRPVAIPTRVDSPMGIPL